MIKVLIASCLLVFRFTSEVETNIHSLLGELENSRLEACRNCEERDLLDQKTRSLNEYRKTLIKEEILNRLGLSSPPNISDSSSLPTQIIENVLIAREDVQITKDFDAYYGNTKQVVVMAEPDKPNGSNRPGIQLLQFRTSFRIGVITSVLLGFHRNPRVLTRQMLKKAGILSIRVLQGHSKTDPQPAQIVKIDRNWVIFNVTKEHLNFAIEDDPVTNISFEIVCDVCGNKTFTWSSENYRPFLVLNINPLSHNRVVRSSKCTVNEKRCCLVDYYVSFADIGWSNWIIAPRGIYFNYCKGSCNGLTRLRYPHTLGLVFQQLLLRSTKQGYKPAMEPCCVATKMTSVSLLYRTGKGPYAFAKKDLPNIRAEECRCS